MMLRASRLLSLTGCRCRWSRQLRRPRPERGVFLRGPRVSGFVDSRAKTLMRQRLRSPLGTGLLWTPPRSLLRRVAEVEGAAADGPEEGLRLELDRIAQRRVVHVREPDAHRPLAIGLRFLRRVVEL